MENQEKIEKLKKEIKELEQKKQENDNVNELLKKRNELKFTKLYGTGRFLKKIGGNIADWADKKNLELEKKEKQGVTTKKEEKSSQDSSNDLYDALFGENELNKGFGF